MKYASLRPKIDTGSIVLFQGTGFTSNVIRWFCGLFTGKRGTYSHVGMIVCDKERRFIFESTTLNGKNGVQMNLLSKAVKTYKGKMVVRTFEGDLTAKQIIDLRQFISDNLGMPYEKHIWELIASATPWHLFKNNNNKDFFCSELIAKVFQLWDIIAKQPVANEYKPDSFCKDGDIDHKLFLHSDAWLGDEIQIT
jgi:hypothetical protein